MTRKDTWPSAKTILEQMDRRKLQAVVNKARERYPNQRLVLVLADTRSEYGAALLAVCGPILYECDQEATAAVRRSAEVARRETTRTSVVPIGITCGPHADLRAILAASGDGFRPLLRVFDASEERDNVTIAAFGIADTVVATFFATKGPELHREPGGAGAA